MVLPQSLVLSAREVLILHHPKTLFLSEPQVSSQSGQENQSHHPTSITSQEVHFAARKIEPRSARVKQGVPSPLYLIGPGLARAPGRKGGFVLFLSPLGSTKNGQKVGLSVQVCRFRQVVPKIEQERGPVPNARTAAHSLWSKNCRT